MNVQPARNQYGEIIESAQHVDAESRFSRYIHMNYFAKKYPDLGTRMGKLPQRYSLDYAVTSKDNKVMAFAELKCRNCSMENYETYMISMAKIMTGMRMSLPETMNHQKIESYLFVRWNDKQAYVVINDDMIQRSTLVFTGRTDRGQNADIEPQFEIPMELFTQF